MPPLPIILLAGFVVASILRALNETDTLADRDAPYDPERRWR